MITAFCVIAILLLIWLCLLVWTTNHNLIYLYDLLKDINRTEEGIFNHVKCIKKELEITGDKWVNFTEELKDVFDEESEESNEACD